MSDDVQLLRINPGTGAATAIGTLARPGGAQSAVRDIAVLSFPVTAHVLTDDGHLRRFRTSRPTDLLGDLPITGLSPGEFLIGLYFEPRGSITAVSNLGHVYDVDRFRGGARRRQHSGPIELSPLSRGIGVALDPANRLRLIDDIGTHLTVDLSGSVTRAPLSRSGIVAIAYSGTAAGQSPTLYGIDPTDDVLVRIGGPGGSPSPDGGEVTIIGPLGIDIDPAAGFDIDPASNMGYVTRRLSPDAAEQRPRPSICHRSRDRHGDARRNHQHDQSPDQNVRSGVAWSRAARAALEHVHSGRECGPRPNAPSFAAGETSRSPWSTRRAAARRSPDSTTRRRRER